MLTTFYNITLGSPTCEQKPLSEFLSFNQHTMFRYNRPNNVCGIGLTPGSYIRHKTVFMRYANGITQRAFKIIVGTENENYLHTTKAANQSMTVTFGDFLLKSMITFNVKVLYTVTLIDKHVACLFRIFLVSLFGPTSIIRLSTVQEGVLNM